MAKIEEKVESLISKTITDLGYLLYDVEYVKEGKDYYLRIYIDSEKGIDLNDCEKVNNAITDMLDEANYIKEQYFLEVSSTRIEKILRKDSHLKSSIGQKIQVNLFKQIDKKKQIIGILKDFNNEEIIIESENKQLNIPRKDISLIKTVYDWD